MTLAVGSLFSGIGGLDLGLEEAGMRVAWQCEIDPFCRRVLASHWPDVPCYPDVRNLPDDIEAVDLICGGFPCQPVSEAGSQRAQEDERWMWPDFAAVLRRVRPSYALVENTSGLLAANRGRAMGDVLGDLAELGYDCEWSLVSACSMDAPHSRDRVFLLAHDDERGQQASRDRRDGNGSTLAERRVRAEHLPATPFDSRGENGTPWPAEPDVGRMADGVSPELDRYRLRALGNAVVPRVAKWIGSQILASTSVGSTALPSGKSAQRTSGRAAGVTSGPAAPTNHGGAK